MALEHRRIALRERPRIGVFRALGLELEEMRAQLGIQLRAILQLRETEGYGEKRLKLNHHPAIRRLRSGRPVVHPKKNGWLAPAVRIDNNGSCDQKSIVTVAKTWRARAS